MWQNPKVIVDKLTPYRLLCFTMMAPELLVGGDAIERLRGAKLLRCI
jgi:hypothetical protein